MKKSFGIVLKKHTHKNSFVLLDDMYGKIMATCSGATLCTGAAIVYTLQPLQSVYRLDHLELLYVPFALAKEDILFLHHILELCCFVVQRGEPAHVLLAHLVALYRTPHLVHKRAQKKIFLAKILIICGFHPDEHQSGANYFSHLAAESLDTLLDEPIHLKVEKELDNWLFQCIATHPHMRFLKTVHFLTRNRAV